MHMRNAPAVLVTGSPRSGTTWAGRMLAASRQIGLVMEPFSPIHHRPGICRVHFRQWFPYLRPGEGQDHLPEVSRMLSFGYRLAPGLRAARTVRDVAKVARDAAQWQLFRSRGARPLLKDPSALFLTKWLAANFPIVPLVLVRHPAAFVSSIRVLGWTFSFDNLLRQPALMEDHLSAYASAMEAQSRRPADPIDEAVLLWNVIHQFILDCKAEHPEWLYLRHEDLSRDPARQFRLVCDGLMLPFDDRIQRRVEEFCSVDNPRDATARSIPVQRARSLRRNSVANITNWKQRLDAGEIRRIRRGVEALAPHFYSDADW